MDELDLDDGPITGCACADCEDERDFDTWTSEMADL